MGYQSKVISGLAERFSQEFDQQQDSFLIHEFLSHNSQKDMECFIARHYSMIYARSLRTCGRHELAEEISQNVIVLFFKKIHQLKNHPNMAGWFYTTTKYVAINTIKSESLKKDKSEDIKAYLLGLDQNKISKQEAVDFITHIDEALDQLKENYREAILLRYYENKKIKDIAHLMGKTEKAVENYLARGLDKIRGYFEHRDLKYNYSMATLLLTKSLTFPPSQISSGAKELIANSSNYLTLAEPLPFQANLISLKTFSKSSYAHAIMGTMGLTALFFISMTILNSDDSFSDQSKVIYTAVDKEHVPSTKEAVETRLIDISKLLFHKLTLKEIIQKIITKQQNWTNPDFFIDDKNKSILAIRNTVTTLDEIEATISVLMQKFEKPREDQKKPDLNYLDIRKLLVEAVNSNDIIEMLESSVNGIVSIEIDESLGAVIVDAPEETLKDIKKIINELAGELSYRSLRMNYTFPESSLKETLREFSRLTGVSFDLSFLDQSELDKKVPELHFNHYPSEKVLFFLSGSVLDMNKFSLNYNKEKNMVSFQKPDNKTGPERLNVLYDLTDLKNLGTPASTLLEMIKNLSEVKLDESFHAVQYENMINEYLIRCQSKTHHGIRSHLNQLRLSYLKETNYFSYPNQ